MQVMTGHLSAAQCEYFKKWDTMMGLEEQNALAPRKEACSVRSTDRERQGQCCARMCAGSVTYVGGGGGVVALLERFDGDKMFEDMFG